MWEEIGKEINSTNEEKLYPLNLDQFSSLLDRTKGNQNIKQIVDEYTDKTEDLIRMCRDLHGKMNPQMKNKCTRLSKKLQQLRKNNKETTSQPSASSSLH